MSETRLQVLLSRAGLASRRTAETMISEGRVTVNGQPVTELGTRADPDKDEILVDGKPLGAPQEPATIIMHKPVQVVTTLDDPEGRETVADLVASEPFRFIPVGRLDYHTEGALLLTTDGELANHLLHPKYHVPKVYMVKVKGRLQKAALDKLREGVELEDGITRPAVVEVTEEGARFTWIEMVVTEGRNRLVRRMCEGVGNPALRVVRTEFATLNMEGLKPGQYRYLTPQELTSLYAVAKQANTPESPVRAEESGYVALGQGRRGRGFLPGGDEPRPATRPDAS
ncbi:MAG: rRNA pseudouridine synthase, partial [Myxococcales bacterium]|nr:rRNA pseudouridine synthase [Myxococcales bacterium]